MNKIVAKKRLSDEVFQVELEAAHIARERKAGQFVIVQTDVEWGERVPLTIADADPARGTITLIFQTVGVSTHRLAELEPGDAMQSNRLRWYIMMTASGARTDSLGWPFFSKWLPGDLPGSEF